MPIESYMQLDFVGRSKPLQGNTSRLQASIILIMFMQVNESQYKLMKAMQGSTN